MGGALQHQRRKMRDEAESEDQETDTHRDGSGKRTGRGENVSKLKCLIAAQCFCWESFIAAALQQKTKQKRISMLHVQTVGYSLLKGKFSKNCNFAHFLKMCVDGGSSFLIHITILEF